MTSLLSTATKSLPGHAVALASVLLVTFAFAAVPTTTNDLFWHVKTGEYLWTQAAFPSVDPFSYTAQDRPWFLHEWLFQVACYGIWSVGGIHGLRLVTGLAAVGIAWLVAKLFRRELGNGPWPTIGVVALLMLGAARFQTRPTLVTMAMVIWLVGALTRTDRAWTWRHAAVAVLAMVVWSNAHSVALLALPIHGAFLAGRGLERWLRRRGRGAWPDHADGHRHALTSLGLATAAVLTPSGLAIYGFAYQDKSEVMQFVSDEWATFHVWYPDNESLPLVTYAAILIVLATLLGIYLAAGVALTRGADRRANWLPAPSRVAVLLACVGIGLAARRFHWMLALALALGGGWLRTTWTAGAFGTPRNWLPRVATIAAGMIALVGATTAYRTTLRYEGQLLHRAVASRHYFEDETCEFFQLGVVDFCRDAGLEGNVFCHYGSGGILTYHLHPAMRVFVDSRIDLYGRAIYLDYLAIGGGRPDQNDLLDAYRTDFYYRHWDLPRLRDRSGWIPIYAGPDGELWARDHDPNRTSLRRCAEFYAGRGRAFSVTDGLAADAAKPGG